MWSLQRRVIVSQTLLAVAIILLALMSDTPSAQAIAGGAPYADPAYCSALPALVTKFENIVLPQQARDLADQKWRLSEAEAGRAEAAEEFAKSLRDGVTTLATDQLSTAKALRARVNAMKSSGMSQEARRTWLESIKKIEDAGAKIKEGMGRADFVDALRQNQTDLVIFMKFVEDSGAADVALKGLADTLAPGVGGLVVSGIKVGMDVVYAGLKGRFTAQEAAQWRENVAKLSSAHQDLKDRVDGYRQDLTGGVCGPKVAQQVQNSPKPIPPAEAARTTPAPRPTASVLPPAPTPGPSLGKILGWTAVIAGGAVGGAYVYEQAKLLADDYSTTNTSTGTNTNTTTTPTSSTANYRYANWNCNNGAQCITVLSFNTGSVGPFCSLAGCTAWRNAYSSGATCTAQPEYTRRGGPTAGRACD